MGRSAAARRAAGHARLGVSVAEPLSRMRYRLTSRDQPMCGRFTQHYTWTEVHAFLSVFGAARNLQPRYNIAPTTMIDVVRLVRVATASSSPRAGAWCHSFGKCR